MRVHELAKELGVTSKELLTTLEQMGVAGKSASSSVPEDLVPQAPRIGWQGHRGAEAARGARATTGSAQAEGRQEARRSRRQVGRDGGPGSGCLGDPSDAT